MDYGLIIILYVSIRGGDKIAFWLCELFCGSCSSDPDLIKTNRHRWYGLSMSFYMPIFLPFRWGRFVIIPMFEDRFICFGDRGK